MKPEHIVGSESLDLSFGVLKPLRTFEPRQTSRISARLTASAELHVARPVSSGFALPDVAPAGPVHPRPDLAASKQREDWTYRHVGKRVTDIAITLALAPLVVPMVLICALLIALDGHNPFYRQVRVGRGGRIYNMWKLRSMVPDADAALEGYLASNPEARAEWDKHQKLRDDPRVTKIGRLIRACSADELPQFWNVMIGDMSVVGPRPMMPDQAHLYPGRCYFALRPGITGPWQVSDRHASTFADRATFDDAYCQAIGFRGDLGYVVRTIGVVLKRTGC